MNSTTPNDMPAAMTRVRFISATEAESGMKLALRIQQVRDHQLFQLPAGVVLTAELIARLRHWHVHAIAIEVEDIRSIEEISRALLQEQERIDAVFRYVKGSNPVADALRASVLEYRLQFN
jgi:hypothetical protein